MNASAKPLAFIGAGLMGSAMIERLVESGRNVRVWNRSPEKARRLAKFGAVPCSTPSDAAVGAEAVLLCLTDAPAIETVLFGDHGLADELAPSVTIIDFSTTDPASVRRFAARAAAGWLDSPVSGGVGGARAGALAVFAGGDLEVLDGARAILAPLSAQVTHMGGVGAGQAAKLCNQLIGSIGLVAIAEAIALGEALGVDVARLPVAFAGGFADSLLLRVFGPRMAAHADPGPPAGAISTMYKDVIAVRAAAEACGVPVPLLDQAEARYRRLIDAKLGAEDMPALMRLYRRGGQNGFK